MFLIAVPVSYQSTNFVPHPLSAHAGAECAGVHDAAGADALARRAERRADVASAGRPGDQRRPQDDRADPGAQLSVSQRDTSCVGTVM